jgi:hypothetical protein
MTYFRSKHFDQLDTYTVLSNKDSHVETSICLFITNENIYQATLPAIPSPRSQNSARKFAVWNRERKQR